MVNQALELPYDGVDKCYDQSVAFDKVKKLWKYMSEKYVLLTHD